MCKDIGTAPADADVKLEKLFVNQRYEVETLKCCWSISVEVSISAKGGTDSAHAECERSFLTDSSPSVRGVF
jgi:hypothetical protein